MARRHGELNEPTALATDEDGFLYVCDSLNNRIQKFDSEGQFIAAWGTWGSYASLLATPTDIVYRGWGTFCG